MIEGAAPTTFGITISYQPAEDVAMAFTEVNGRSILEGGTTTETSLVFTAGNWDQPQTLSLALAEDEVFDTGPPVSRLNTVITSDDPNWNGISAAKVFFNIIDNDGPQILMTPTENIDNPLVVHEDGIDNAQLTIQLNMQPTGFVEVSFVFIDSLAEILEPDSTELEADIPVVVFDDTNWDVPVTITLTGIDDNVADGDQEQRVIAHVTNSNDFFWFQTFSDQTYVTVIDGLTPAPELEPAGITVDILSGKNKLRVDEHGQGDFFSVVLDSKPTSDVLIDLVSTDRSEGSLSLSQLIFTTDNWNVAQIVEVVGLPDNLRDRHQRFQIQIEPAISDDLRYSGLDADDLDVVNRDKRLKTWDAVTLKTWGDAVDTALTDWDAIDGYMYGNAR